MNAIHHTSGTYFNRRPPPRNTAAVWYGGKVILFLACIVSFLNKNCMAQAGGYNLSIYNGLPSNNVYNVTIDSKGYLWIATDKGPVKYDGHHLKTFDLNSGFVRKDIWCLFEDRRGRMWLSSISDNLGYIYEDKYHSVVINNIKGGFYPKFPVIEDSNGICFTSTINNSSNVYYCIVRNDTLIATHNLAAYGMYTGRPDLHPFPVLSLQNSIYYLNVSTDTITCVKKLKIFAEDGKDIEDSLVFGLYKGQFFPFGRYVISAAIGSDFLKVINTQTARYSKLYVSRFANGYRSENMCLLSATRIFTSIITPTRIYNVDTNLRLLKTYTIDSLHPGMTGNDISFLEDDPFWGRIIATKKNGIYISSYLDTAYRRDNYFDPEGYEYMGNITDGIGFWWNPVSRILACTGGGKVKYKHIDEKFFLPSVAPLSDSNFLLLTGDNVRVMNKRTFAVEKSFIGAANNIIPYSRTDYYVVSRIKGLRKWHIDDTGTAHHFMDDDRLNDVLYDSLRDAIWAYNSSKIVLYKPGSNKLLVIGRTLLERLGLNSFERILIDNKYGNVFIQESGRLLVFRYPAGPFVQVLNNYVLNGAHIRIAHGVLVVAGTFGTLFSKIIGPGQISAPIIYPNVKRTRYTAVNEMAVIGERVWLKTDKGTYFIQVPSPEILSAEKNKFSLPYKLMLSYNNTQFNMNHMDTVRINRRDPKLQFDMINPMGDGPVQYRYRINGRYNIWHDMTANELVLPQLGPDKYYRLSIIAYDNQWRSNVMTIGLYVKPYWWEKKIAWRLLWLAGFLLVGLLVYIIVLITKRIVSRNHAKRNMQLELELKSVYSQINPHFIFNSLGVAMYLVKTKRLDDAYQHIHKFSHLLRSYIRSSRNRFVILRDEIANLRNYIELQQARFDNRFEYEINIDDNVNQDQHIPSLLLQPIVENAIAHGLLHKEEKGHLRISFKNKGGELTCIIEDDGIGRIRSRELKDEYVVKEESYGNLLIEDLVTVFNKYEKKKIEITVTDLKEPLTGTLVELKIKNRN